MRVKSLISAVLALAASVAIAHGDVLGKLGQTTESAPIYSSMRTGSRVYYRAKPYEYLVIQETKYPSWYRVLLQNGAYGYVVASRVAKLPYEVTQQRPTETSYEPSRGAMARSYVARQSLRYLGTPYKWGGDDMYNGVDCSGFVKNLYGQIGIDLPRTAAEQAMVGQPISRLEDLQPGDRLYFWENKRGEIGHTGIYLGGGYFVHSSHGNHGVATDYLGEARWRRILVAARR